jgi:hypothetical protein
MLKKSDGGRGQNHIAPGCPTSDLQEATNRLPSHKIVPFLMNIEFFNNHACYRH